VNHEVTCPKCAEKFPVGLTAFIPSSQVFKLKLESESQFIASDTIATSISSMTKILKGVAKEMGSPVSVFVKDIQCTTGVCQIEFLVTTTKTG
jgi:hypothetical protein